MGNNLGLRPSSEVEAEVEGGLVRWSPLSVESDSTSGQGR